MARRRHRGEGSIFRSGDRWVAQVGVRDKDGKRRFVTRWRRTERLAKLALDGLLSTVVAGGDPRAETAPLGAYMADWLTAVRPTVRPRTFERYENAVRLHIGPLLGEMPVGDVRPADVRRLIAELVAAGKAPATIGMIVGVLRRALDQALRDELIVRNPATAAALPRIDRAPVEALTPAKARQIMAAVAGDPLEALWLLLLGSGLRRGEALALDWADVDLEHGSLRVRSGKTRAASRTVPVPAFALAALRANRDSITGPVFRGRHGRLTGSEAVHAWDRLLARTGIGPLRIHDLRHGTATLLLASGTPMRVIAEQLGHSDPAMTARIYAHVVEASQRQAIERLDELLTEGSS